MHRLPRANDSCADNPVLALIIRPVNELAVTSYVLAAVVAAITSGALVRLLLHVPFALDSPNNRSLHISPTPRTGGVGLLSGVILGIAVSIGVMQPVIWIALGVAVLSFVDDRWNLPVAARLSGHLVSAALFVTILGDGPAILLLPFLVVEIGWMTNLYNFMDGADGLAGGMTVFGFGAYAIAAGLQGHDDIGALSLCVASAAVGFLIFYFPPARIFLGDVGAIPIGFLAGAIGLLGWREGLWPPVFPVIVFAPFIVDATVTLAKRAMRKEPVWRAPRALLPATHPRRLVASSCRGRRVHADGSLSRCRTVHRVHRVCSTNCGRRSRDADAGNTDGDGRSILAPAAAPGRYLR